MATSEAQLKELGERRFDELEILIVYIDGIQFGEHHVIVALGVDRKARNICSACERASETPWG
jgi:hypothetical protein